MADANIKAVITADDKASKTLKGFGDHTSKIGHGIASAAKLASKGLIALSAAAVGFGALSVKAFMESENVLAQLNATLKSTGGVAGVTADDVTSLATSLQKVTRFSDEAIVGGENLLLTFTKIGKDIFPEATEVMLDMSTALGQDVKSSAIQLGKALQDPILGVTALRRVGVNFNEEAKETIKNFVETNQLGKAQAFILKELQTEFGGSAKAAGKTFAGQLDILKNRFNDVQETIGKTIVTALIPFANKLADVIQKIDWEMVIDRTTRAIKDFWHNYLVPVARAIGDVAKQVGEYLIPKLQNLWDKIVTDLVPALSNLWHSYLEPLVPVIGIILVGALGLLIDALAFVVDHINILMPLMAAFGTLLLGAKVLGAINKITVAVAMQGGLVPALQNLAAYIRGGALITPWTLIAAAGVAAFVAIQNAAQDTMDTLKKTQDAIEQAGETADKSLLKIQQETDPAKKALMIKAFTGKQLGGPISRGQTSIVGERRPELFVPREAGRIVPQPALSRNTNQTISLNVNIGMFAGSEMEKRKIAESLMQAWNEAQESRGMV